MMKKRRKSVLLLATMGVFLINGCGAKEEVQEILSSVEEQTTVANETQLETFVQSEEPTKTESA